MKVLLADDDAERAGAVARVLAAVTPRPVVLFVDEDDPGFMEEAIGAGVSSYNAIGMPPPDVKPILRAAVSLFRRHQQARDDLKDAESRLRERAVIDKAKALLIEQRRMSEPDAYKFLRRTAMSTARRIVDVASDTIKDMEGKAG